MINDPIELAVASPQQLEAEALVRELWPHPLITAARRRSKQLMLGAYGVDVPPEAMRTFDAVMDEYAVSYLVRTVSRDRENPRLIWNYNPPFERQGQKVLGSRFCGDNPDSYYRFAGIHHGDTYRIRARPAGTVGPSISFNLMRNWGGTDIGPSIDLEAIVREPDGGSSSRSNSSPAAGRRNHLQTDPAVCILIVRECLNDWTTETPMQMTIEREGARPGTPPDLDRLAAHAARWIVQEIPLYFWMIHLFRNLEPNTVRAADADGRLRRAWPLYGLTGLFASSMTTKACWCSGIPSTRPIRASSSMTGGFARSTRTGCNRA